MTTVVRNVRLEYRPDTSCVAVPEPRVSWVTSSDVPDWIQQAAELAWDDGAQALTHRVTIVDLDGVEYLVDVGFGPLGPRGPVPVAGEHGTHRVAEVAPGEIHVQSSSGGDAVTLYRFERSTYGPADCELGHFYSHRHPRASFVNNLVASRILDDEVRSLRNHDYWVMRDSGTVTRTVSSAEDLRVILNQEMDLLVTEDESARLFAELPDPA